MEDPQNIKNWPTIRPSSPTAENISEGVKSVSQKDTYTTLFIAALFTTAKYGDNLMFISEWMDKEDVVYTHNGIFSSSEKEGNPTVCDNVDGPWGYYAKWSKSEKETLYLESKKYQTCKSRE